MDIINRINATRFLGREFLTHLWYASAKNNGVFDTKEGQIEVWFDQRLTLTGSGDITESSTMKAETPTETKEAHASLLSGKVVSEARLRVIHGQKQWACSVKGETLQLGGVKVPSLLSREDDDRLQERFMLFEELEDLIEGLYRGFIELRLDPSRWGAEVQCVRQWVHGVAA